MFPLLSRILDNPPKRRSEHQELVHAESLSVCSESQQLRHARLHSQFTSRRKVGTDIKPWQSLSVVWLFGNIFVYIPSYYVRASKHLSVQRGGRAVAEFCGLKATTLFYTRWPVKCAFDSFPANFTFTIFPRIKYWITAQRKGGCDFATKTGKGVGITVEEPLWRSRARRGSRGRGVIETDVTSLDGELHCCIEVCSTPSDMCFTSQDHQIPNLFWKVFYSHFLATWHSLKIH